MSLRHAPVSTSLLAGGALLIAGSQLTAVNTLPAARIIRLSVMAFGILLFALGALSARREGLPNWLERLLSRPSAWLEIESWKFALLIAALPMALLVPMAAGISAWMLSPVGAVGCWFAGMLLAIIGGWRRGEGLGRPGRGAILTAAILTALALLARGFNTARIPIFLTGDEASAGLEAGKFLSGAWNNIFLTGWYSFPSLYFYIQSIGLRLFGQTTEALRLPSALAGALTVAAVYFAGRRMFDQRTGLLAAIFMAGFHYHIHFSRIGLNNIWDGLWYTITIAALWIGWEKDRRSAFLLAGLGLGMAQYFYPSARTLIALTLAWLVLAAIQDRQKARRALPHLLPMFVVMTATLLPLIWWYAQRPDEFMAPLARVSVLGPWLDNEIILTGNPAWRIMLEQFRRGFAAFTVMPLQHWYLSGVPMLRPAAAGAFILGLVLLFLRWRDSRLPLLSLWLLAFGALGALSESTPAAQRYVAVSPALALLVGFGISETADLLSGLWPRIQRWLAASAVLAVVLLTLSDLNFYFNEYTPESKLRLARSNGTIAQTLADYLETRPDDLQVVFLGFPQMGYYSIPSLPYLAPQKTVYDVLEPWNEGGRVAIDDRPVVFVVLPFRQPEITQIVADYPDGQLIQVVAFDGMPLYFEYHYPAAP